MADINITYETLFELLRRERKREEIQELSQSFYQDVINYLAGKAALDEGQKGRAQMENIKKILRELYEKRERKIISMAMTKSRTGSDIFDVSSLLPAEKKLYEDMRQVCDRHREKILFSLLKQKTPPEPEKKSLGKDVMLVRFISPVPKFVGRELEPYGPFEAEDVVSLPPDIAKVLISKGRAEEIAQD
jgi:DNA replication factor GINS